MKMKLHFTIILHLSLLLYSFQGHSQQTSADDKLRFRSSIHKVKVWTRIANDTTIGFYDDAMKAVRTVLHRKGYRVEQVFYDKSRAITPHDWEKRIIDSLAPDEAFLDLLTRIIADSIRTSNPDIVSKHVVSNGVPVAQYKITPENSSDAYVRYQSFANADFYVRWKKDTTGSFVALFSKRQELPSGDIFLAVKKSLSKTPASANPVAIPGNERVAPAEKTRVEIGCFAGYVFPSSMDIIAAYSTTLGKAEFNPSAHYGVDVSFGLTHSIDMLVMYDRQDTKFTMKTEDIHADKAFSVSINYILMGAVKNFRVSHVLSPYAGLSFGSVNITQKDDFYRDVWYFALNPQAGMKVYLSRLIGLRFQAYCMYQIHPRKAPFLYSDNSFSNYWNAWSNMLQVGFSGGIIFRIGTGK
jgi:hypothetical protein